MVHPVGRVVEVRVVVPADEGGDLVVGAVRGIRGAEAGGGGYGVEVCAEPVDGVLVEVVVPFVGADGAGIGG